MLHIDGQKLAQILFVYTKNRWRPGPHCGSSLRSPDTRVGPRRLAPMLLSSYDSHLQCQIMVTLVSILPGKGDLGFWTSKTLSFHSWPLQQLLSSCCRSYNCAYFCDAVSVSAVEQSEKKALINNFSSINQHSETKW